MSVTCVPPFRGEFGHIVMHHAPAVRALPRPVVVCIEPGMEALYPDCEYVHVERKPDGERRDTYGKDAGYVGRWTRELRERYPDCRIVAPDRNWSGPVERFVPVPASGLYQLDPDVVICPRKRAYGAAKNWPSWATLAGALGDAGLRVFAAGNREASDTQVEDVCDTAWVYKRPLDASIEAMRSARVVIATDAGLAHLAVLCGAPLLLVTHEGRTAPGPQVDENGRIMQRAYGPVKMGRYHRANHTGSPIDTVDGWTDVDVVVEAALERVEGERAA